MQSENSPLPRDNESNQKASSCSSAPDSPSGFVLRRARSDSRTLKKALAVFGLFEHASPEQKKKTNLSLSSLSLKKKKKVSNSPDSPENETSPETSPTSPQSRIISQSQETSPLAPRHVHDLMKMKRASSFTMVDPYSSEATSAVTSPLPSNTEATTSDESNMSNESFSEDSAASSVSMDSSNSFFSSLPALNSFLLEPTGNSQNDKSNNNNTNEGPNNARDQPNHHDQGNFRLQQTVGVSNSDEIPRISTTTSEEEVLFRQLFNKGNDGPLRRVESSPLGPTRPSSNLKKFGSSAIMRELSPSILSSSSDSVQKTPKRGSAISLTNSQTRITTNLSLKGLLGETKKVIRRNSSNEVSPSNSNSNSTDTSPRRYSQHVVHRCASNEPESEHPLSPGSPSIVSPNPRLAITPRTLIRKLETKSYSSSSILEAPIDGSQSWNCPSPPHSPPPPRTSSPSPPLERPSSPSATRSASKTLSNSISIPRSLSPLSLLSRKTPPPAIGSHSTPTNGSASMKENEDPSPPNVSPKDSDKKKSSGDQRKQLKRPLFVPSLKKKRPYSPVEMSLIVTEPEILFNLLTSWLEQGKTEAFWDSIVELFADYDRLEEVISFSLIREIRNHSSNSPGTLLRSESIGVKLLSRYFVREGFLYLRTLLRPLISQISASHVASFLETEPSMRGANLTTLAPTVITELLLICQNFLDKIFSTSHLCPPILRRVCKTIHEEITDKFGIQEADTVVGCFFFLRFICPSIVNSTKYVKESSWSNVFVAQTPNTRALLYVTKFIQNMANHSSIQGGTESIERLNLFIATNRTTFASFIDDLVNEDSDK